MQVTDPGSRLATLTPQQRALVEQALRRRKSAGERAAAIPRRPASGPAPLSSAQQRIWFLEQWEPGAPTHHGARVFRLHGELRPAALEAAFRTIIERHEILRTVYVVRDREPWQVPLDEWSFSMPVVDLTAVGSDEREVVLEERMRELAREPFALTSDLFLRATLFKLGAAEHVLLVRLHHIAFDASSDRPLLRELGELYAAEVEGRTAQLDELPIQYADYAVWQRDRLENDTVARLIDYWRETLADAPQLLRLPIDHRRRDVQRHEGSHRFFSFSPALAKGIVDVGRDEGATVYMTLLAAFAVLLYRISGDEDIVIGSPIAGRGRVELERLIGFFTNTLALRIRLGGNPSFREAIRRVRATALGAFEHQELPFERIVEELRIPRDPSYNPLFQVNFRAQQREGAPELVLPGIDAEPLDIDIGFSRFDLALELRVAAEGIDGYFEFDRDLFDQATIDALTDDLHSLLQQIVADPDRPVLAFRIGTGPRRSRSVDIRRTRTQT